MDILDREPPVRAEPRSKYEQFSYFPAVTTSPVMEKSNISNLRNNLLGWYHENHRPLPWRQTDDPYHIWVSEVMLQQTQVNTVIPYYERFLACFPDIETLAGADLQDVLKIWEGLGYYARARNLHRAAQMVVTDSNGTIPSAIEEFRKFPGVGEYIAAAVMSIAFHQPHAVVDGNVKRVLARLLCLDVAVNETGTRKVFRIESEKLLDPLNSGEFNQGMMDLGARICTPARPDCAACPISTHCCAYHRKEIRRYPKRSPARSIPEYHIATGVVYKRGKVLITRRQPEGLLGGLWEFPGGKVDEGETQEEACVREIKEEANLTVSVRSYLTRVRHAYSHFRIEMDVYECDYTSGRVKLNGPVDFRWVSLSQLDQFPFPKANLKFIPLLQRTHKK